MRASEISPKKLVVFDIDDTLVHTQTKVHVVDIKTGEVIDSLNSHDFTHYRLKPGEEFDFSGFRNAREFFEKSKPIIPMMRQLKQDIATGNKVVMVTARADFDDKEIFLDTFRKFGIDMSKVHVYRAGNSKEGTTEERKKAIIKRLLDQDDYSKAIMYDDAKPNLHTFIELKKDHPRTRFYAWHVNLEGEASEYMREEFPQPGPSSGAPKQFGTDAKIQTRQMTAKDIISSVPGVPYYNNVIDDWDAKDFSWNVTKKVIEYAEYLKQHPETLSKLPPAIVLNGRFEDGAHRVSALWLLQQRMDPQNPLWKNHKLNVQFVTQGVAEGKKTKRKSRWAAYGPGPFGGYGFAAGYSGDGGIGEDQNQIKIYMSHDPDYMGAVMVKDYNGSELTTTTIPSTSLDGFEPDSKMKDPRSAANVEKIIKGIKSGDNIPPILVRKLNSGYQVIDGHHRFWAQKKIGIHDISVKIVPSKYIQDVKNKDEIPPEHLKENQGLTELNVAATLKFIKDAHGDQLYGKLPYWRHPRAVAMTGRKIFGSRFNSDAVKAAFLHDVVEDTDTKLSDLEELGFSDRVIEAVSLLTKDPSLTYFQNIDRIITSGNEIAQMVKYADNYENYTSDKSDWASDRAASSNRKYLQSLDRLGDHLGVKHHLEEASYSGNIGAMETIKFYKLASDEEKRTLKELINKGKLGLAWHLIQQVTGVKLQGQEFSEDRTADVVFDTGEQRKVRYHPTSTDIVDTIIRYYLKQGLRVVKVDDEDIDWDHIPEDISEGWRDIAAGLALGAGVGLSGPAAANFEKIEVSKGDTVFSMAKAFSTEPEVIRKLNGLDKDFTIRPGQVIRVPKIEPLEKPRKNANPTQGAERKIQRPKIADIKTLTGKPYEALLTRTARSSGITDPIELAAFLAQTSVETGRFKHMREVGNKQRIERMYDLKFNRQGAKVLGNTKPGDGWRYRGRGFIQLTGRDNYTRAGRDLGLDLAKDPDILARDPEVAARASVWYWKTHVRPQVKDFRDTAAVTKAVQGGSSALDRREREFQNFKRFKLSSI